jgi:hypothetical protein
MSPLSKIPSEYPLNQLAMTHIPLSESFESFHLADKMLDIQALEKDGQF